jgi:FtsZ-binding cell division protein ZapB
MELVRDEEVDSLTSLEERILKAVETVAVLKREKDTLEKQLAEALSGKEAAERDAAEAHANAEKTAQELENLRGEQKKVRSRIEKLLGQIDSLTAG